VRIRTKLASSPDDAGAILALAVVFIAVVGLVGGALVGLAGGSLTQTQSLAVDRTSSYAAESAIDVAIQNLRTGTSKPITSTPGYVAGHVSECPTLSVPVPGYPGQISVMCGFGQADAPWQRVIVFSACPSSSNCLSGQSAFAPVPGSAAIVSASTLFNDLRNGCTGIVPNTCFIAGNTVDVSGWKVGEGQH
jgi:hypothetical protein